MEWVILFIVSWILFFTLVDFKSLKYNIICGLLAMSVQIFVDYRFTELGLYSINNKILGLLGSSIFFPCGPVLVIGTLMSQFQPRKRFLRIINVLVLASLFSLQEVLILSRRVLIYLNWTIIDSIGVNICTIGFLSWFAIVVLKKERNQ